MDFLIKLLRLCPPLLAVANRWLINHYASTTPPRPHPLSGFPRPDPRSKVPLLRAGSVITRRGLVWRTGISRGATCRRGRNTTLA